MKYVNVCGVCGPMFYDTAWKMRDIHMSYLENGDKTVWHRYVLNGAFSCVQPSVASAGVADSSPCATRKMAMGLSSLLALFSQCDVWDGVCTATKQLAVKLFSAWLAGVRKQVFWQLLWASTIPRYFPPTALLSLSNHLCVAEISCGAQQEKRRHGRI